MTLDCKKYAKQIVDCSRPVICWENTPPNHCRTNYKVIEKLHDIVCRLSRSRFTLYLGQHEAKGRKSQVVDCKMQTITTTNVS